LPSGRFLELRDDVKGAYLYHESELGVFYLGSDAITHSYKNHKRKKWLTDQIPTDVDELFNTGSTIGAYIVFPKNRIDGKHTINQARGVNSLIDDRFDLTLECIRRFLPAGTRTAERSRELLRAITIKFGAGMYEHSENKKPQRTRAGGDNEKLRHQVHHPHRGFAGVGFGADPHAADADIRALELVGGLGHGWDIHPHFRPQPRAGGAQNAGHPEGAGQVHPAREHPALG